MQETRTRVAHQDVLFSEVIRLGIPAERAQAFLSANLSALRSPWDIPGMDQLVARVDAAARENKSLLLLGDFDTDGTTATAVLHATLARRMPATRRYNPRYHEGYGLQTVQVERLAAEGVQVIATIDNGITAHAAVERARQLGVETLIIDHHLPRSDIGAPKTTIIDPPDNVLSASQVGYLVAQALRETWWGESGHDEWGLALAAVGAQMDWMPLDVAENRGWVAHAQQMINSDQCPAGLASIRRALGEDYTSSELLTVGSPLNLGKRLKRIDPNLIVELLLPNTPGARRDEIAAHLVAQRKRVEQMERSTHERALSDAERLRDERGLLIYTVESPDDDLAELEGPLANKLTYATGRPTLTLRHTPDLIAFSGRAAGTFSFASFISDAGLRRVVNNMGGHAKAMGGAFKPDRLDDFIAAARAWEKSTQGQDIWADTTEAPAPPHNLAQLSPQIAVTLARALGPFGHRFRRPMYETVVQVRDGRATSGTALVETNLPLPDGTHRVTFTFDEAQCNGDGIGIAIQSG
jgi:single-stranded-DNA-specific exonuclease